MRTFLFRYVSIALLLMAVSALAVEEYYPFDNDTQRERFLRFTHELRCPKCQGQTLAGSDAGVAANLKDQLHRLIIEGKSDEEIKEFMVARYGDFVLYNPPVQPNTYLLWFGPIAIFVIGAIIFIRIILKQRPQEE